MGFAINHKTISRPKSYSFFPNTFLVTLFQCKYIINKKVTLPVSQVLQYERMKDLELIPIGRIGLSLGSKVVDLTSLSIFPQKS